MFITNSSNQKQKKIHHLTFLYRNKKSSTENGNSAIVQKGAGDFITKSFRLDKMQPVSYAIQDFSLSNNE